MAKDESGAGPPNADTRRAMNRMIRRLQPGMRVFLLTAEGRERRLDVLGRGVPDWADDEKLSASEIGHVLEGYGTTYLLQSYRPDRDDGFPWLHWPSREGGVAVWNLRLVTDGEISAEMTADDLLWRINENDGQ